MECKTHGHTNPAILCNHVVETGMDKNVRIGWVQAEFDRENREPGDLMAWCNNCDKIYETDGGWNETNDTHFKVVCDLCFLTIQKIQQASPTVI